MSIEALERYSRIQGKRPTTQYLLDWYDAWLRVGEIHEVATALDVTSATVRGHLDKYQDLRYAKELAEKRRGNRSTFTSYIYSRMSPEAQKLWEDLQFWEKADSALEKIETLLNGRPKRIRQELFINALVVSNFDLSSACRMAGVPYTMLENWRHHDADFKILVEEIQWHKKNFFERHLIDLVEEHHPAATIFVNRTVNADRGYNEKLRIEGLNGDTKALGLDDLDLDIETRKKVLDAVRRRALRATVPVIAAAAIPVETPPSETEARDARRRKR